MTLCPSADDVFDSSAAAIFTGPYRIRYGLESSGAFKPVARPSRDDGYGRNQSARRSCRKTLQRALDRPMGLWKSPHTPLAKDAAAMNRRKMLSMNVCATAAISFSPLAMAQPKPRKTKVSIVGNAFHINGQPTYRGRMWQGKKIEGLLMNSRMVQGIFDDENPDTRGLWAYPDGPYDADRNTNAGCSAAHSDQQRCER